jgi:hypothetical protein
MRYFSRYAKVKPKKPRIRLRGILVKDGRRDLAAMNSQALEEMGLYTQGSAVGAYAANSGNAMRSLKAQQMAMGQARLGAQSGQSGQYSDLDIFGCWSRASPFGG